MGFIQIVEEKRNDKGNVKKSEQKKVKKEGEGLTAKIKTWLIRMRSQPNYFEVVFLLFLHVVL